MFSGLSKVKNNNSIIWIGKGIYFWSSLRSLFFYFPHLHQSDTKHNRKAASTTSTNKLLRFSFLIWCESARSNYCPFSYFLETVIWRDSFSRCICQLSHFFLVIFDRGWQFFNTKIEEGHKFCKHFTHFRCCAKSPYHIFISWNKMSSRRIDFFSLSYTVWVWTK